MAKVFLTSAWPLDQRRDFRIQRRDMTKAWNFSFFQRRDVTERVKFKNFVKLSKYEKTP